MKKQILNLGLVISFLLLMSFSLKQNEITERACSRTEVGDFDGPLDGICSSPGTTCESPVVIK